MATIGSPNYHCCVGFVFFRFSMPPVVVAIVVVGGGCGGVVVGVAGVVVVNCCLCRYPTKDRSTGGIRRSLTASPRH